jgi:cupin 2 domain-containing protein
VSQLPVPVRNLFADVPAALPDELFTTLIEGRGFRLERIVSEGHATPGGEWCDQARAEWVVLLRGGAGLRFEGHDEVTVLRPGDAVLIPAHARHRVEWTTGGEQTTWLALHYDP